MKTRIHILSPTLSNCTANSDVYICFIPDELHTDRIWSSLNIIRRDENVTSVVDRKVGEWSLMHIYLNLPSVTITHPHRIIYKLLIIALL